MALPSIARFCLPRPPGGVSPLLLRRPALDRARATLRAHPDSPRALEPTAAPVAPGGLPAVGLTPFSPNT